METLYFSRSFTSVRRSFTSIQMCHTHTPAPFVARNSLAGRRHRGTRRMQCLQVCLGALLASVRREYVTAPEESRYNATNGQVELAHTTWKVHMTWATSNTRTIQGQFQSTPGAHDPRIGHQDM